MPIRFACTQCRQALQIASRKAGTIIKCPKCQAVLTVPAAGSPSRVATQPPAAAPKAPVPQREAQPSVEAPKQRDAPSFSSLHIEVAPEDVRPAKLEPDFTSVIVFDDVPAALTTPAANYPVTPPSSTPTAPRSPATNTVPFDPRLVAVSRTVLYAQAILIAAVAMLSFAIGYYAGRGVRQPSPEELLANQQPVLIEGDVVFQDNGSDVPDAGAVIIAVPHGRAPGQKFAIDGLKPGDPLGPEGGVNLAIQAVESEGGAYARADENGQFRLNVRPGKYWIVAISSASKRPAGMLPTIHDVKTLGHYFDNAVNLLGDHRYQLSEKQLPEDAPLEIALDAKP